MVISYYSYLLFDIEILILPTLQEKPLKRMVSVDFNGPRTNNADTNDGTRESAT